MEGIDLIIYDHFISVKEYNNLRYSVGWTLVDDFQAEEGLKNSSFIVVARDEGTAIGMSRVVSDGGYIAIIVDVVVRKEYQGQGIGSELMEKTMAYLDSSLKEGQHLMINLMATHDRESFYEKHGFISRPNDTMGSGMVKIIDRRG